MKFIPLIWSGIWRKPGRTILALLQVGVAFALFGVLQGMKTGVNEAIAKIRADVLMAFPDAFGAAPLPLAYIHRLRSMPGVKTVTFGDGLVGTYQKPTQTVYVFGIPDDRAWGTLLPEMFTVLPKDREALHRTRTGALINDQIAKKYGWKVGDRIPLTSASLQTNGSGNWVFDVVGTFVSREPSAGEFFVANYAYLDEARALFKGTVRNFYVVVSDPKQAASVAEMIDRTFANSSSATRTQSMREYAQQGMQQIGDLDFVIRAVVSAVLVALLFSVATMMMQTIRERTPELAVLKTIGFTDGAVFFLLLGEAIVACVAAAALGLALATAVFPYAGKYVPGLSMPTVVIGIGLIGAILVALISTALPAFRASRLDIVDALAGR